MVANYHFGTDRFLILDSVEVLTELNSTGKVCGLSKLKNSNQGCTTKHSFHIHLLTTTQYVTGWELIRFYELLMILLVDLIL